MDNKKKPSTPSTEKFFDRSWWRSVSIAATGAILGIIITFGSNGYLKSRQQRQMADKIVSLAIHNLDVSISQMDELVDDMKQTDSIYRRAMALMPDRLGEMNPDTLRMIVRSFGARNSYITDNSTQEIFSSSIEVWQNLDDPKVIGRIGNCYSILNACSKEYDYLSNLKDRAYFDYINESFPEEYPSAEEAVKAFLSRRDVRYIIEWYGMITQRLEGLVDVADQLNERNKEALGLDQEDLDEVGNLLDSNSGITVEG